MPQATAKPYRDKVMAKIPAGPDIELHVRTVKVDGLELVDLRQYIVSQETYGRGVNFEAHLLDRVIEELRGLHKHIGTGNGSRAPGKGQGKML